MSYRRPIYPTRAAQRGITLIEALIALLILALGVLGLAQVQARMLVETRTTNSRATAIRLIADLGDRIRANANAAPHVQITLGPGPTSPSNYSAYAEGIDVNTFSLDPPPTDNPVGCTPTPGAPPCTFTPSDQARYDLWTWRTEVANDLMNGKALISQVNPQQLRVIIAWQANENTDTTLNNPGDAAATQVAPALQIIDARTGAAENLCNPDPDDPDPKWICYVDFINIPATNL
jgi:type IV pilus assembly protein PilV